MRHLTSEQIQQMADPIGGQAEANDALRDHLSECRRCSREVESFSALFARLHALGRNRPKVALREVVSERLDLPGASTIRHLTDVPRFAPARGFAHRTLSRVDLPHPALDRAIATLPHWCPSPAFATTVMDRVRLRLPWRRRVKSLARRPRRTLVAASVAAAASIAVAVAWPFGIEALSPIRLVTGALESGGAMLMDATLAAGRLAWRAGLIDSAGSFSGFVSPMVLAGWVVLSSLSGITALWGMARYTGTLSAPIQLQEVRQ